MNAGGICLRCGTPYEPDDTVCYHCGAPIGETEGDTAPVKIIRTNQSASTSTAEAPLAPPADEPGASAPPEVDPSRITVGSTPAMRPTAGEAGLGATALGTRRPRGRRTWLIVVIAAALALAAVGGALYTRHSTTPPPPPVAQQTLYTDPGGRFHLLRPALWTVAPSAAGVALTDSDGSSSVTVAVVAPGSGSIPTGTTAASYADQLAQQLGGATPLGPLPARQIAGTTWEQREGRVTGADGAVRETLLLVTLHTGNLYAITCTSPVASFGATQNLVFDPLLGSFAFGG